MPLHTETPVLKIERISENQWRVHTGGARPETIEASCVILATGGLALPKSGSDGRGYKMARELGHSVIETTPALTPLLGSDEMHCGLSGPLSPRATDALSERQTGAERKVGEL